MADLSESLTLAQHSPAQAKASILLVDDTRANLLSLRAILEDMGLHLVESHSGEEALQRVMSEEFAVVLLDVCMPGISGFETARRIRANDHSRHTPIIFLTATDIDRSQLEEGYALGAVDFLIKPLLPVVLRAKVRGFLELFEEKQRARREAAQLRLLVQGTTEYAIFLLDPQGHVVTWNAGAQRLKGYTAEEIIGQHFSRFYPQEAIDRGWTTHELTVAQAEGRFEDEGWRVRKDSSQFWANVVITALRDEAGNLLGFSKITRDMSDRKKMEENARRLVEETTARRVAEENARLIQEQRERLRQQEEWLRVTLGSIGDAVIATDTRGGISFLNGVAEELTGWPLESAQGQPLETVFAIRNDQTRQPIDNPVEKVLRHGAIVGLGNHTVLISRDGSERPIDDSAAPIRDADGKLLGVVLIFRDVTERRRSEQAIRESERELADFFENATVGLHLVGPDGTILRANRAELDMLGYRLDEYVGRPITDFHADQDVICDILRRLQAGEQLREYPARLRCKDGSIKHVLIDSSVMFQDGRFVHTRCFTRDVTEQKQAESELLEAQRRLQAVFNQQFQFMAILDPDGTVLDANDTCFRATGVPREFVLGRLLWDTPCWGRLPAMQERWKRYITEAAQSGGPVRGETEYTLADETVRHATVVVTGVRDEVGQVTSIIVEGHDDTDRKRNEAILGTQKTVLELLVHGAPLPDVLDALCEVIEGQSQDKLIATVLLVDEDGQHLRSVAGRRAPPAYAQAVDGVAIGPCVGSCGTAAYRGEQVVVSDIATDPLWANFRELALGHGLRACWSTPIFSSQGKVLGTFAVYYPSPREPSLEELRLVEILTRTAGVAIEKRRDEQALRDADRRKDEFLATLAHELRNPLSPIRSSLQILKMPRVDAETIKRSRDMMERQVQHLVRLVDDLLDVSRVMRGKIELRKEPVELATLVARAVETAQPLLDTQGHQLNVRLPAESLLLDADPVRLTQVIGNLLTNAAKYTDPNGQIGLTAERDGETAVLRVQDNGIGIAPDMLRHIFALFVQVDHAATRSQGGLGIGLTLVKNLVEMHGGAIEAHSAGLGKGSEFVVRLPILAKRSERESGRDNGELAHVPPPPSGYRVLIVDDNEDAANSLAVLLRLQGHEVGVAYSGMAALEMTKAGAPDVVFLDIGMPGMDGCEVARRLRQQPGLEHVVLVALTGWGQQEDRRRTAAAGFNHHLVKPPEPKALEVLLSDLQKHHA